MELGINEQIPSYRIINCPVHRKLLEEIRGGIALASARGGKISERDRKSCVKISENELANSNLMVRGARVRMRGENGVYLASCATPF